MLRILHECQIKIYRLRFNLIGSCVMLVNVAFGCAMVANVVGGCVMLANLAVG